MVCGHDYCEVIFDPKDETTTQDCGSDPMYENMAFIGHYDYFRDYVTIKYPEQYADESDSNDE